MAEAKKWFQDRYFITFLGMMIIIVVTIMSNPILMTKQTEEILKRFDNATAQRDKDFQTQKVAILNNMTGIIVGNQKVIIAGQENIIANLSRVLMNMSHLMQDMDDETDLIQNLTLQIVNRTNESMNKSGTISGLASR